MRRVLSEQKQNSNSNVSRFLGDKAGKDTKQHREIYTVLRSLTNVHEAENSSKDVEKLWNFLPGGYQHRALELLAFTKFVSARHERTTARASGNQVKRIEIFDTYFFTNMYREIDAGTKYLRKQLCSEFQKNNQCLEPETTVFRVIAYRLVNKMSTFEKFNGIPAPHELDRFLNFLADNMSLGEIVFTRAHQCCGLERLKVLLKEVKRDLKKITIALLTSQTLEECVAVFSKFRNISDFFGWQICCDLIELDIIQMDENSWVCLGPGAKAGLQLLFEDYDPKEAITLTKHLTKVMNYCFSSLGLPFEKFLGKDLTLKNIEHALCEYSKLHRIVLGSTKGRKYTPRKTSHQKPSCSLCGTTHNLSAINTVWRLCRTCVEMEQLKLHRIQKMNRVNRRCKIKSSILGYF